MFNSIKHFIYSHKINVLAEDLEYKFENLHFINRNFSKMHNKDYVKALDKIEKSSKEIFNKIENLYGKNKDKNLQNDLEYLRECSINLIEEIQQIHKEDAAKRHPVNVRKDVLNAVYLDRPGASAEILEIVIKESKDTYRTCVLKHLHRVEDNDKSVAVAYPGLHGFLQERTFLKMFNHKNVLGFIDEGASFKRNDVIQHPNKEKFVKRKRGKKNPLDFGHGVIGEYVILEYAGKGDLKQKMNPETSINQKKKYALEIIEGLSHMHSHHVVHLDIKGENILLAEGNKGAGIVKICDFDCAQLADGKKEIEKNGTPERMAPELRWGDEPGKNQDPKTICKMDHWSTGILIAELLDPDYVRNDFLPAYRDLNEPDPEERKHILNGLVNDLLDNITKKYEDQDLGYLKSILPGLLDINPESRIDLEIAAQKLKKDLGLETITPPDLSEAIKRWEELNPYNSWKSSLERKLHLKYLTKGTKREMDEIIKSSTYEENGRVMFYNQEATIIELYKFQKIVKDLEERGIPPSLLKDMNANLKRWIKEVQHPRQSVFRRIGFLVKSWLKF